MAYTIQPSDDMRLISMDELNYYHEEALPAERVRPRPHNHLPRVFGAVVLMEARDDFTPLGGLVRVLVNTSRQKFGFPRGIEISVLDLNRNPVAESAAVIDFDQGLDVWRVLSLNAIYNYVKPGNLVTQELAKAYTSSRGFFIREPNVIRR